MQKVSKIMVLGGGTAGWMAANLFAKALACDTPTSSNQVGESKVEVTLLESPEIGIVGVGEGSTPQLKTLFDYLEIPESDWMPQCNATYKNGIRFKAWSSRAGCSEYFHAFPAKTDRDTVQAFIYNCYLRRQGVSVDTHPNQYFLPAYLAESKLGPKPDNNFPFPVSYGYHFDSYLVGEVLKTNAIALGVTHISDTVDEVQRAANGNISGLCTASGQTHSADLFIDCSGFASLLIGQTLKVPFYDFSENLFNDSAVVMPSANDGDLESQTVATALSAGWAWDIPLTNRNGNGYVYSSNFITQEAAEVELRTKLKLLDSDVAARQLKMRVGQVREHWSHNCLAVGLSQGFIEPLEATALHLAQETIESFIGYLQRGAVSDRDRLKFNQTISARFEGIRDYIVCHYKMAQRDDTDYWQANISNPNISDSLSRVLQVWRNGEDLALEVERQGIAKYYPVTSWHSLLAGYGAFPELTETLNNDVIIDPRARRFPTADLIDFNRRCAMNFGSHVAQLERS